MFSVRLVPRYSQIDALRRMGMSRGFVSSTQTSKPTLKQLHAVMHDGRVSYAHALAYQRSLRDRLIQLKREQAATVDSFVLLEHAPVYTLGRNACMDNVLFDVNGGQYDLFHTDRGGEVTYHGPGQLVGYLVFDLDNHRKDLHWFLREIEASVIRVLAQLGIDAHRHGEYTGVWVGDGKIAAIGLSASRWVSMHGFSINLEPDLGAFSQIIPCGINDPSKSVTSIRALKEHATESQRIHTVKMPQLKEMVLQEVVERFGFEEVMVQKGIESSKVAFSYRPKPSSQVESHQELVHGAMPP